MNKMAFSPDRSPRAVGAYNHGVRIGNFLFTAGQIPLNPDTNELVEGDIEVQTEQVLKNLGAILEHEGLGYEHLIKTTLFLADMGDFGRVNAVYGRYIPEPFPARSAIQVAALPKLARIEIEAIAAYPEACRESPGFPA